MLAALVAVLVVLVAGYVILADRGRDVSSYAIFLGGPLVSSIVGVILTKRVAAVQASTDTVVHQTNSILTARLDHIDAEVASGPTTPHLPADQAHDGPAGEGAVAQ